jgi:mono/diheme cytochrome c family protein
MACTQRHRWQGKGGQREVKISRAWWLGAGLVLFGAGAVVAHTQQTAPEAAVAAPITDGPTAFRESGCVQCHQIRGVGGHRGPDLSGVGRRMKKPAIENQIRQGGGAMPAFGDVLPSDEIAALVKYLNHCRDKKPQVQAVEPAKSSSAD